MALLPGLHQQDAATKTCGHHTAIWTLCRTWVLLAKSSAWQVFFSHHLLRVKKYVAETMGKKNQQWVSCKVQTKTARNQRFPPASSRNGLPGDLVAMAEKIIWVRFWDPFWNHKHRIVNGPKIMCFFRVSMQIDQNSKLQANISASQDLSSLGPRVWAEPKLINISKKFPWFFFSILIWVRCTRCFDVIPNLERWVFRPDATIHKLMFGVLLRNLRTRRGEENGFFCRVSNSYQHLSSFPENGGQGQVDLERRTHDSWA